MTPHERPPIGAQAILHGRPVQVGATYRSATGWGTVGRYLDKFGGHFVADWSECRRD